MGHLLALQSGQAHGYTGGCLTPPGPSCREGPSGLTPFQNLPPGCLLQGPRGYHHVCSPHSPKAITSQRMLPALPLLCPSPTVTVLLTDLMAQHPLQPVLPGPSQVDGQRRPAVLHHHHRLRQEVISELHHHLQKKEATSISTAAGGGDAQWGLGSKQKLMGGE